MDEVQSLEQDGATSSKKPIERSAAYPAFTIEESLLYIAEFYKHFRNNFAKRDDIYELVEGTTNSKIAACGHYGLLEREKDRYHVTKLYTQIVNNLTDREKIDGLFEAFGSPKLYKELIEKFDGDIIPEKLAIHLFRFHRITENAAPAAAEVFLKNAKYIGILDDNNKLLYKSVMAANDFSETLKDFFVSPPNHILPDNSKNIEPADTSNLPESNIIKQPLLLEINNEEKLIIRLTGNRRAYLSYPNDLNEKDISILKLQLDSLALTL